MSTSTSQNFTLPSLPELFDVNFLDTIHPQSSSAAVPVWRAPTESTSTPPNPMIDALAETTNQVYTENSAPALQSTESATLDAFHRISPWLQDDEVRELMEKAWSEDPSLTLRIIWYMRSIHEGKSDKKTFYASFGWLYKNHPKTAIANLHLLVDPVCPPPKRKVKKMPHGYYKDLLNILQLATVDQLGCIETPCFTIYTPKKAPNRTQADRDAVGATRYAALEGKLQSDPSFKALYVAVAQIFAAQLVKDMRVLDEIKNLPKGRDPIRYYRKLSLAGKWAPTPGASHDRITNISTAIALLLHYNRSELLLGASPSSLDNLNHFQEVSAKDATTLRSYYQRWILTSLRDALVVPETLMAARRWKDILYDRVSSQCMQKKSELFFKHDSERFEQFLIDVESGKRTISGATLLPHEIIAQIASAIAQEDRGAANGNEKFAKLQEMKKSLAERGARVAEAQWQTLVSRIKDSGLMDNALAVCDVSGSMGSMYGGRIDKKNPQPIYSSIALSLLLACVTKPPFNGGFITFSHNPEFVKLDLSQSLQSMVTKMQNADWGMNTDFNAVFMKLLLPLAKEHRIKKEDMIKRLFVFSDMQFDVAASKYEEEEDKKEEEPEKPWKTNYDEIVEAYKEAGYEMPEIVYWDLSCYDTVEVKGDREGVAMMKGFSASMMKAFLGDEDDGEEEGWEKIPKEEKLTPVGMMMKALMRPSFDGLVLLD